MIKKEIAEIKRQFTPANCSISRICGCYVDGEKNKKADFKDSTVVVLVGGLFRNEIFAAKVKQYVKENLKDDGICFKCPEKSPAEEGLTFALRAYPK